MYETCIFDLYGTLVDIHTDEKKEELWEKLALFYAFYGAFYMPGELREAYGRLTEELSAGKRGVRKDAHEAFPEIQIEDVFEALFGAKRAVGFSSLSRAFSRAARQEDSILQAIYSIASAIFCSNKFRSAVFITAPLYALHILYHGICCKNNVFMLQSITRLI